MNLVALQNWLDNATFAVLFLTMLMYWAGVAFPNLPGLATLGTGGMAIANLSIATLLGARWIEAGYFPLSNLYESLFFLVWGITAVHLFAENTSRSRLVGVVTAPVAMGITAFAALTLPSEMQSAEPLVPALKSNWLMMHVSVMMLSYAALMVGSLLAMAFLIVTRGQNIQLQGSSVGNGGYRSNGYRLHKAGELISEPATPQVENNGFSRFETNHNGKGSTAVLNLVNTAESSRAVTAHQLLSPQRLSLAETLDNISYRIIGLGFPLITIGIIAGAVWANEAWGSYWSWDPKETWALITWLVFAAYLHARITRGWQGRRPAILAASGFVVVWICYLGVNLLGKGLHSYGWFF
ncbi:c-type cytochrome biogenesis protein CcsB [Umezakia ovalisporum]|jgi:cytochrome c-type biogenesis protein CcsB|uniref:Cytochrome c biogenesis protein CcsA n=2 Tax=Umezakia ovalisporum TaxID=75695 RepID=A0AA43GY90_9CYAN|nr:c-type cytochrome biogenesis protein CcsB [Umezakia ovalisporum]MDH6057711.1 c-type cytochrome biogenesis protein CcsB [Umezakia ovalisporum FSS-43]MDH6063832.1 c-type cytochrome biogenesis protein CcsB [Umezakia ovalisporum FSS-62]MDH6067850.1 c-type cytochrome biogenesis protein CcsB [Umezakia ovalisporum APH033B]MDH6072288.1 c-type cytochrome biogenesis protein CcsB [Umezakia ovalisporum CobakiLakeA]MDH6074455.1 c-type cytochrome biogenesis protein CcsB [Umezakia ovalisporum CS-1034]